LRDRGSRSGRGDRAGYGPNELSGKSLEADGAGLAELPGLDPNDDSGIAGASCDVTVRIDEIELVTVTPDTTFGSAYGAPTSP
jgi:hypothetical protein